MKARKFSVTRTFSTSLFSLWGLGIVSAASGAESGLRLSLSLAESRESLTNNRPNWREQSVTVSANRADKLVGYVGTRDTERFGLQDSDLNAGIVLVPTTSLTILLEGTKSGEHRVLARDSVSGQISLTLGGGWVVGVGLRRSRYNAGTSHLGSLAAERYFGAWRLGYNGYLSHATGTPYSSSHRLAVNYDFTDDLGAGLSAARGRELENVPSSGLRVSSVVNVSANFVWRVLRRAPGQPDLWLRLDLGRQEQGDLYTRRGASFAARLGF